VWFYLRGEEYSAQIDYFAQSIAAKRTHGENTFRSALDADRVVSMIVGDIPMPVHAPTVQAAPKGLWARIFG
jgi:hypothetical protein